MPPFPPEHSWRWRLYYGLCSVPFLDELSSCTWEPCELTATSSVLPEYDVEAAQEKDRQAFKPTDILRKQKTNCDGYAGLFERMCRYERQPVISKGPGAVI